MKPPYLVLLTSMIIALAFGVVAPAAAGGGVAFARTASYTTGSSPWAAGIGDLNGDGKPDLAVSHGDLNTSGAIGVFDNLGGGKFGTRQDYSTGSSPSGLVLADLNADGRQDMATADSNDGTVSVLLNNGHGFAIVQPYVVGQAPSAIAAGDVDRSGTTDLVVADGRADALKVLYNDPLYGFWWLGYATGQNPVAVAVGDLNRDGSPDAVTANSAGSSVSVLLNYADGTGYLQSKHDYGTTSTPTSVAIGDLNGDGAPELAVAESDSVSVFLNDGSGGFGSSHDYPAGTGPSAIAIADLNGDGKADVEVANAEDTSLSVFLNNGDGTLQPGRNYMTGDGANSLAFGDLNADGRLDFATSNLYDDTASVLINKPGVCDVQDVTEKTLRSAKSVLARYNCRVAKVVRRYSKSIGRGRVISQKPGFGGVLPGGGKVKLVVSRGRRR
jgi:hypothetical protein